MTDPLIDKFRADIQISRGRTGKPNALLLTITANDAEELCSRIATLTTQLEVAREALGTIAKLRCTQGGYAGVTGCLTLWPNNREWWCVACIARDALATLSSPKGGDEQ